MLECGLYEYSYLQNHQEFYAHNGLLLLISLYIYTIYTILHSGRFVVHSYVPLLVYFSYEYHSYLCDSYTEQLAVSSGEFSLSVVDSLEIMCLLMQMRHLPQLEIFHMDLQNEEMIDEIIDLRIPFC